MTELFLVFHPRQKNLIKELNTVIPEVKFLASFYFIGDLDLKSYFGNNSTYLLDSGAFSAKKTGSPIDINNYISFIQNHEQDLVNYFNLDVIGDATATEKNQKIMESAGLTPIPVFHPYYSPLKELESLCSQGYDYIALGGLVGQKKQSEMLQYIIPTIPRKVKIHLFGITTPLILERFRVASADSSNWASGGRFGNHYLFSNGRLSSQDTIAPSNTKNNNNLHRLNLIEWKKYAMYLKKVIPRNESP